MFTRICKYLSFGSIAILILYMAATTVLEKFSGTAAAMKWGYHSLPFIALWAVAAVCGAACYLSRTRGLPLATSGIHLAFLLILSGALITHVSGVQGAIHLRTGAGAESVFTGDDLAQERLPFSISLSSFEVEYYPGTQAPCDYVSRLEISDGGAVHTLTVAMNRAAAYRGYRFFQSSYDEDGRGSTLAVSHDPLGTPVSYAGYGLLLLSLAAFFFQKGSRFRAVLRRMSKGAAVAAVLLAGSLNAPALRAGTGEALPGHLPEETAETLEDGWLKTGDLGYVDEDGFVYLTGRKKNLIITKNGENVSPEELENALSTNRLVGEVLVRDHNGVIEAEIYPDQDYVKKKRIKDVKASLQEVIDQYNKTAAPQKKIYSLIVRDTEFEKTTTRKIKRF